MCALIQPGPMAGNISGSIGSTVFARNRSGAYIRNRTKPVDPQTQRQVDARDFLAEASGEWNNLTDLQRDAWRLYADSVPFQNRLGEDIFITGQNMYVRTNTLIFQANLARLDDAPTLFSKAEVVVGLSATASEATQLISVVFDDTQAWASEDDAFVQIRMAQPRNAGVFFNKGPYRIADQLFGDLAVPLTSPQDVQAPFAFAEGQQLKIDGTVVRADGRVGPKTTFQFNGDA